MIELARTLSQIRNKSMLIKTLPLTTKPKTRNQSTKSTTSQNL